ncbi:MAG: CotH kinase family protein [Cyclobacteriaceae bacterium]
MKVFQAVFHFFLITLSYQGFTQGYQENSNFPEIRIYISNKQLDQLRNVEGTRMELKQPLFLINKDTAIVRDIHSRGASTMKFARKSLSVDLEHSATFNSRGEKVKIKKFDLLNLVMDKDLWHNRWAFINLNELNLFPLFNTYCKLWINDQPQGIYLLVEKPSNSSARIKSPYMLRRGPDHKIEQEYINIPSKKEAYQYKEKYYRIYRDLGKYKGQALEEHLRSALQLDQYFNWLAFNYFIKNGDYADEIFFYIHPDSEKFDIIPWDYDDIFRREPHEGAKARQAKLTDKLIFSIEDELDRSIASDEWLYDQYRAAFKKLLITRDMEVIGRTFDQVLQELEIVANDPAMNQVSGYMEKDSFRIDQAKESIRIATEFLLNQRIVLLKALDK